MTEGFLQTELPSIIVVMVDGFFMRCSYYASSDGFIIFQQSFV